VYREKLEEKESLEKKRKKTQKELDKLKVTVKQIDEFNEKVKGEILVTRRAAYGTEEAMQKLEKGLNSTFPWNSFYELHVDLLGSAFLCLCRSLALDSLISPLAIQFSRQL